MTKKEAIKAFRRDVMPEIRNWEARFPNLGIDLPKRRMEWNNYVDDLNKAGYVSDNQADNWTNPF